MIRGIFTGSVLLLLFSAASIYAQSPPLPDDYVPLRFVPGRGLAPGMKTQELGAGGRTFKITFARGDEVLSGMTEFAEKNHLKASHVTGIGALDSAVLGWYDPEKRAHKKIVINQEVEVASFIGSINLQNGKPVFHAHAVLGSSDGSTKGGHFVEGHVSVFMEVFVVETETGAGTKTDQ